jgi:hypothetical protein
MDEMRCILYAHGGMDISLYFPVVLNVEILKAAIILVVWIRRGPFSLHAYAPPLRYLSVFRYSIQRFARKIRGRVLGERESIRGLNMLMQHTRHIAVNYRLAPQYPFPCALQDLLAACEQTLSVLLKESV